MNLENEKRFYIDFNSIRMCYPYEVSKKVSNFGVLNEYKDKKYTLKEINDIIATLITKTPYVANSMSLHVNIMNGLGYHYILDINNYNYGKQVQTEEKEIHFLY